MMQNKTYVIAEAGVNHNGSFEIAAQLVEKAAEVGADAIKFQSFVAEKIVHPNTPQAEYQKENHAQENQYKMLKKLELSTQEMRELKNIAYRCGIDFVSTPFDLESLDFLLDLDIPFIKISSGDITYGPLLLKAAQSNKKVILSTGMAVKSEILQAFAILAFGYLRPNETPAHLKQITDFFHENNCMCVIREKVTILHCTSEYPAPLDEINLNVLDIYRKDFSTAVGYSDHSAGIFVPSLAVAKGAKVIEKHFTLDNRMEGPDHKASLNVSDFAEMVRNIRLVEEILGCSEKKVTASELKNKALVRRGIYVARDLQQGEKISSRDIICLRPETENKPQYFWDMIGKVAQQNYKEFDAL